MNKCSTQGEFDRKGQFLFHVFYFDTDLYRASTQNDFTKAVKIFTRWKKNNYNLDLESFKNVQFLVWHAHTRSPTHRKKNNTHTKKKKKRKNVPA